MLTAPPGEPLARHFLDFDLGSRKTLIVAVSGGSDSTALLVLLKSHLDATANAPALLAVTIDHQLRSGSADEASAVGALCESLGVAHRTLSWTGAKPATGLAAAAREARYRLLRQAASEAGTDIVLTGHTADDQAETVAMRQRRGHGRGLAGMAPATLLERETWLLRPLLTAHRTELRDMLRRQGHGWIDDPTNDDTAYERPRIRATMTKADRAGFLALAAEAAARRVALGRRAANLIGLHAEPGQAGLCLDHGFMAGEDREAQLYALRLLLAAVGDMPLFPSTAQAALLLRRLAASERFRFTLSRTLMEASADGIRLSRERRGNSALGESRSPARLAGFSHVLPCFDMAPAQALAGLFGAPEFPSPPLRRHDWP